MAVQRLMLSSIDCVHAQALSTTVSTLRVPSQRVHADMFMKEGSAQQEA